MTTTGAAPLRVLLTGRDGQLGQALLASVPGGISLIACGRAELDLADPAACAAAVAEHRPDWVLNAGAYTAVDRAESEPELAMAVNAAAPEAFARALADRGGHMLQLSTDFVFAGDQGHPYRPDQAPRPLGVYGASKAEGERRLALALPQQSPFVSSVAGIVYLLPGFMLTVAMSELATQNYLAGTGRLAGAFILLFLLGVGLAIGTQAGQAWMPPIIPAAPPAVPGWATWLAISALGVSLLAVLQAPLTAVHVSVGACLLAWAVFAGLDEHVGNIVAAFAGALAVASAGQIYQQVSGRPAALVQIPGLITLVPGSMGFRGVHALMQQDNVAGVNLITEMLLTGAVLAVGLLLADNIWPVLFAKRRAAAPSGETS